MYHSIPLWLASTQQLCPKRAHFRQRYGAIEVKTVHLEFNHSISILYILDEAVMNLLDTLSQWKQSSEICSFKFQRLVIQQPWNIYCFSQTNWSISSKIRTPTYRLEQVSIVNTLMMKKLKISQKIHERFVSKILYQIIYFWA